MTFRQNPENQEPLALALSWRKVAQGRRLFFVVAAALVLVWYVLASHGESRSGMSRSGG